jgi:hypothetical protein
LGAKGNSESSFKNSAVSETVKPRGLGESEVASGEDVASISKVDSGGCERLVAPQNRNNNVIQSDNFNILAKS